MSFKSWAASQDQKQQQGPANPAAATPGNAASAPKPVQAPAQASPAPAERKAD